MSNLLPDQPYHTIYVDMDEVLTDYQEVVSKYKGMSFRELVIDKKIFLGLPDHATRTWLKVILSEYLWEWPNTEIQILSSGGVYNQEIFDAVVHQKNVWLDNDSYFGVLKRNFTHCGEEKAKFAAPGTLLIDDNANNIHNFVWNGGDGVRWFGPDIYLNLREKLNLMPASENPQVEPKLTVLKWRNGRGPNPILTDKNFNYLDLY